MTAARQAMHRYLYAVANSNAMNGIDRDTVVKNVLAGWQIALYVLAVVILILDVFAFMGVRRLWTGMNKAQRLEAKAEKTFFDYYILGVNAYANLDYDKAYQYLKKSCDLKKEYYNLASLGLILLNVRELFDEGYEYIRDAVKLNPEYIPLAVKLGEASAFIH